MATISGVLTVTNSIIPMKTTSGSYIVNNTLTITNSIGAEVTVTYANSSSTITTTVGVPRPINYPTFIGTIKTFGQNTVIGRWS